MKDRLELLRRHIAENTPLNATPSAETTASPKSSKGIKFPSFLSRILLTAAVALTVPTDTSFRDHSDITLVCIGGEAKIRLGNVDKINGGELSLAVKFPGDPEVQVYPYENVRIGEIARRGYESLIESEQESLRQYVMSANYPSEIPVNEIVDPVRSNMEDNIRRWQGELDKSDDPNDLNLNPEETLPNPVLVRVYRGNLRPEEIGTNYPVSAKFLDPQVCETR